MLLEPVEGDEELVDGGGVLGSSGRRGRQVLHGLMSGGSGAVGGWRPGRVRAGCQWLAAGTDPGRGIQLTGSVKSVDRCPSGRRMRRLGLGPVAGRNQLTGAAVTSGDRWSA
jgi:hypothetical protein